MIGTSCTLRTSWNQTSFPTNAGIRQGAVESPLFFGVLVEWIIEETAVKNQWEPGVSTFPDLQVLQAAYMDDLLIWDGTTDRVQQRLRDLQHGFAEWGLSINIAKCSLYVSPKHKGPCSINIDGVMIQAKPSINVMGLEVCVESNVRELLQPVFQGAKAKFWCIRHLLKTRAPLSHRLRILSRVVGGAALCIAAFTPETSALQAVNQLLYQCVIWLLGLKKGSFEDWSDFRKGSMRQARQVVCLHLHERWSTIWLSRFWSYMGHVARGLHADSPPCSSLLNNFRNNVWWTEQQQLSTGARHNRRFFPKLAQLVSQLDRAVDYTAGGEWRQQAQDREAWRGIAQQWILQNDIPWNSRQQFAIEW